MKTFASARDAKEFLVSKIVAEAQREGIPLTEIERKMLYFTETAWTLPDMMEVNDAFDRDYDQDEYEEKIRSLSRNLCDRTRKDDPTELDAWHDAIRILSAEDHYILVLIDPSGQSASVLSPRFLLHLVVAALAVIATLVIIAWVRRLAN